MHLIHANIIPAICRSLARLGAIVDAQKSAGRWETDRKMVLHEKDLATPRSLVESVSLLCEALECGNSGKATARLLNKIDTEKKLTFEDLARAYEDIEQRLDDELEDLYVFIVPRDRSCFWAKEDIVSEEVKNWSGEIAQELFLAGNAYCCDLHTACVFHSMRAAEKGLRLVAEQLEINITGEENWKNVIDQIQSKARALDGLPKSPSKAATCKHYSEIAIDAGLMKDAWRNHVAHAKVSYVEGQALVVLNATRRFCEKIACPPPEDS